MPSIASTRMVRTERSTGSIAAVSVETVMREVLLPYLLESSENRWASGDMSVAQEHFASALLRGRLLGLARGWGTGSGPTLVLACPPGEQHDLGLDHVRNRGVAPWPTD